MDRISAQIPDDAIGTHRQPRVRADSRTDDEKLVRHQRHARIVERFEQGSADLSTDTDQEDRHRLPDTLLFVGQEAQGKKRHDDKERNDELRFGQRGIL